MKNDTATPLISMLCDNYAFPASEMRIMKASEGWSRASIVAIVWACLCLPATCSGAPAGSGGPPSVLPGSAEHLAAWAEKVDARIFLESADPESNGFLVMLGEQADLSGVDATAGKLARRREVIRRLQETARRTQTEVLDLACSMGLEKRPFWVANIVWVRGGWDSVGRLASLESVEKVYANPLIPAPKPAEISREGLLAAGVEWNIANTGAPEAWSRGYAGAGAVVGGADTGYQWDHPALKGSYRGWDGTTAIHDYNWHDAIHSDSTSRCGYDSPAPCDDSGHGTHTMGTVTGDDGGGNQVGMAPQAKWVGCRCMDAGFGTPASYIDCFQWFLSPTDISGNNPDPAKAPDVVNNSWGCPPDEGCVDPAVLLPAVRSLRAGGIVVVASAGNAGPGCSTVKDPIAIYGESFSVGATTPTGGMASFSSRGPVTVDGSGRMKPDVSAPGAGVRSCFPGGGYAIMSGTSMAAPHVAGAVAIILSAKPSLSGRVEAIEDVLRLTSAPVVSSPICGGVPPGSTPDNACGWGRIDAAAALNAVVAADVDGDGTIDRADAGLLCGVLAASAPYAGGLGDLDGDGRLTAKDLAWLCRIAAGVSPAVARSR